MNNFVTYKPYTRNQLSNYPVNISKFNKEEISPLITKQTEPKISIQSHNVFFTIAGKELDFIITNDNKIKYRKICTCDKCRNDIIAVSITKLPKIYLNKNDKVETKIYEIDNTYNQLVSDVVYTSINKIKQNPSINCEQIKNNKSIRNFSTYWGYVKIAN